VAHGLTLKEIEARLRAYTAKRIPAQGIMKKAAVATVLRDASNREVEVLFIRRAEHPRDPWSGHMAFPGGRVDRDDKDPLSAALRETREELGLDLAAEARHLGALSQLMAMAHGKPLPMVINPFVFELTSDPKLTLNHEVQEALWVPLARLCDPDARTTIERPVAGVPIRLPCVSFEGRQIWGLTLRMADELISILAGREETRSD
jgi:8-oxo-dGTP pyrophosphatase MutT (NUDIX family)